MNEQPMSYLEFKLNMEMNYQNTFENNEKVKKEYKTYLQRYRKEQKKRRGNNPRLFISQSKTLNPAYFI